MSLPSIVVLICLVLSLIGHLAGMWDRILRQRNDQMRAAWEKSRWRLPYVPDHYTRGGGHRYASTNIDNVCVTCQGIIDPAKIEYSAPGHILVHTCSCGPADKDTWRWIRLGPKTYALARD